MASAHGTPATPEQLISMGLIIIMQASTQRQSRNGTNFHQAPRPGHPPKLTSSRLRPNTSALVPRTPHLPLAIHLHLLILLLQLSRLLLTTNLLYRWLSTTMLPLLLLLPSVMMCRSPHLLPLLPPLNRPKLTNLPPPRTLLCKRFSLKYKPFRPSSMRNLLEMEMATAMVLQAPRRTPRRLLQGPTAGLMAIVPIPVQIATILRKDTRTMLPFLT